MAVPCSLTLPLPCLPSSCHSSCLLPQAVCFLGKPLRTFHSLCISLSHWIKRCHRLFLLPLVYLKTEQSSCPRKFKKAANRGQRLFACQGETHWTPCSVTCPSCCCFQPFRGSSGSAWSPCPSTGWAGRQIPLSPMAELHISEEKSDTRSLIQLS